MCMDCIEKLMNGKLEADVIDLRGGDKDAMKKVLEGLAELIGSAPSEEEEQAQLATQGQKLGNELVVASVANDTELLLNLVTKACGNQKLAGATLLAMGACMSMVIDELWGGTGEERITKFVDVARRAAERVEEKKREHGITDTPEETPEDATASA